MSGVISRHRGSTAFVAAFAIALGCAEQTPPPVPPPAHAAPPTGSTRAAPASPAAPDPPCSGDAVRCACDAAERQQAREVELDRDVCAEGLVRAREAIVERRSEEAIRTIDATLEHCTRHTRANSLAERGHAAHLLGRDAEAIKDFDTALDVEQDPSVAARILIDRGDVLRALGRTREADESFYWSNRLVASKVALDRVSDRAFCPVRVSRGERPTADGGWLAWWKRRTAGVADITVFLRPGAAGAPTTDAEAHAMVCPECKESGPWVVEWGFPSTELRILAKRGDRVIDFGAVGTAVFTMTAMATPYDYKDSVELSRAGRFTIVHAISVGRHVDFEPGHPPECEPTPSVESVVTASHETETYLVLDVARGVVATRVELRARFPLVLERDLPTAARGATVKSGVAGFEVSEPACGTIAYAVSPD